jgi:predicted nucleic acid-binding protein
VRGSVAADVILFDTGPIVAAAFTSEEHYGACTELFTGLRLAGRRMLLPATVAAEVGYLLNRLGGPEREAGFLDGVAEGGFEPVNLNAGDYQRMAELVGRYRDLPLGTTDASLVALAERLDVTEIATLDRRHFTTVRPRHVEAFALLPEKL